MRPDGQGRNGRQQRRHALPQVVWHKISTHPHSLPTKIASRKIAGLTQFAAVS